MRTKKRFIIGAPSNDTQNINFEELLSKTPSTHALEHTIVKGRIIKIDNHNRYVTIEIEGLKQEAMVPLSEFGAESISLQEGGDVEVYIDKLEGKAGKTVVSREKAIREEKWKILEEAFKNEQCVKGSVIGKVKGGFVVDLSFGIMGFLPGSQVGFNVMPDTRSESDISNLMYSERDFLILRLSTETKNVVLSIKAISDRMSADTRRKKIEGMKEGVVLQGVVKNITDYGVFVDLGGIDGLLHVTDIAWTRINHPSEKFHIGQHISVQVVGVDYEKGRVSLGTKQLTHNPWHDVASKYKIGSIIQGKVTNFVDHVVFVEIDDSGVEGMVPHTEIAWKSQGSKGKQIVIGTITQCKIIEIDTNKNKIFLSIKRCYENPWQQFAQKYPIGSTINASIKHVTDFGMFAKVGEDDMGHDIDGMIHASDISWENENYKELMKNFPKDQIVECKVLGIDVDKERINLGIKQLTANPHLKRYTIGETVNAAVYEVKEGVVKLNIAQHVIGIIHTNDIFNIGAKIQAKIIDITDVLVLSHEV